MKARLKVRGSKLEEQLPLPDDEQGYMLLMLIVAIGIILIGLSVAATKVAFSLRRDKEVESMRRADQYVRAIRLYYKKFGHYPGSIEQLEQTNNIRFLRQRYVDPLTGKPDYRLILVGQNKTTVKGFFGQPLTGLATTGLGAAAGMQSAGVGGPGVGSTPGAGVGGAAGAGAGAATGAAGAGAAGAGTAGSGAAGAGAAGAAGATSGTGATGSTDASGSGQGGMGTGLGGTGSGPFMGVGTSAKGSSINTPNEQTEYENWEFLWDPRLELLKQKAALNAGVGSAGAGSLGTTPGGFGSTPASGSGTGAATGNGTGGAGPSGGIPTRPQ